MAIIDGQNASAALRGFSRLTLLRQVGLMVGLALSIAIGVSVVMWSQKPSYQLLFGNLSDRDAAEVMEALQKRNVPYRVDEVSGAVMVPASQVRDARLQLATDGLPRGTGAGFELLDKDSGLGTSQFIQNARYQRALEGELERTILRMKNVESARVHLAIPKQSAFLRPQQQPTASVLVNLYAGRKLDEAQVAGIVHLVASSVPNLDTEKVTVVDDKGRLLNNGDDSRELALSASQFDYARRVEGAYRQRIEDLLTPIVGLGRVRAQVVAEIDMTMSEETAESFDSQDPALRSQQTAEEESVGNTAAIGIPGALSNQPPGTATVPEQTAATAASAAGAATDEAAQAATKRGEPPVSKSRRETSNYELDKTISHTRKVPGQVRRLSVAVVIDDKLATNDAGEQGRVPYTDEEVARFTLLVKEAVGFDEARGDRVSVVNASFTRPEAPEEIPEPPVWEQPWVWDVGKNVIGAILVLLLMLLVLRPLLRSLAEKGNEPGVMFGGAPSGELPAGGGQLALAGPGQQAAPQQTPSQANQSYEQDMTAARSMVSQDPKRVAQVMRTWVASDGG